MAYTWNKRTWSLHTYVLAYNKNTCGPKTQQAFAHVKVFFLFFLPVNTRTHHQNSLYVNKVPEDFLCSARCLIHPLPCPPECCVYIYIYSTHTHTDLHTEWWLTECFCVGARTQACDCVATGLSIQTCFPGPGRTLAVCTAIQRR